MAHKKLVRPRISVNKLSPEEQKAALSQDAATNLTRASKGAQPREKLCPKCRSFTLSRHYFAHRCGMPGPTPQSPAATPPGTCPKCGKKTIFHKVFVCHNCCYVLSLST